jgi:hypothetical protein
LTVPDPLGVSLLCVAGAATVAAAARAVRVAGVFLALAGGAIAAAAFGAGGFADAAPFLRGLCVLYGVSVLGKTLALGRRRRGNAVPAGRGLAYLVLWPGLDPAAAFVRDPAADRRAGAVACGVGAVEVFAAFAIAAAAAASGLLDGSIFVAAWLRAASFVALIDGAFRAAMGGARMLGLETEENFRDPWFAESLADFWARRWNRFVATSLQAEVYRPVKRRWGRIAGVVAAFLASGLLHEALFRMPVPGAPSGRWLAFFAVQAAAVLALSALLPGPGRSLPARLARRAAMGAVLLASAPLFFGGTYPVVLPLEDVLAPR